MTTAVLDRPPTPPAPPRRRGHGHPWLTLIAVATAMMVVGLDTTVVTIANPDIAADLDAGLAALQWVTNGYLLALAASLIPAGRLADRFGRKRIFMIGLLVFTAASIGVGLSGSIGQLIAWRVVQGLGGAMLQPASLALIRSTFPAERLKMAIGLFSAVVGLSIAGGPVIGGLLVESAGWESVFFVNAPVALVGLLLGARVIRESKDDAAGRSFDVLGIALLVAAMFGLVWGLIKAQDHGFGDTTPLVSFGATAVLGVLFVLREIKAREPLLPLRLFGSFPLSMGMLLRIGAYFAMFGGMFFLMLFLQNVHGMSPLDAGVRVLPMTGAMLLASPAAGALTQRFGTRPALVGGMAAMAAALFSIARFEVDTSYARMWPWLALLGVGFGLLMVSTTEVILDHVPARLAGIAGGLQQTAAQVGGVLGTSILGVLLADRVGDTLTGELTGAGVPPEVAAGLAEAKSHIAQGVAPIGEGTPPGLADA
ncbi:MAG TPA: DHA2 family efflux MFS transporter permease subunit, partial [Phytomonospora sp.]